MTSERTLSDQTCIRSVPWLIRICATLQSNYKPPEDFAEFIEKHQKAGEQITPVGLGSMPYRQVEYLVNALVKHKVPAILIGTAMQSMKKVVENKKNATTAKTAKEGAEEKDANEGTTVKAAITGSVDDDETSIYYKLTVSHIHG